MCPKHHEILQDSPGNCLVCGDPLHVKRKKLSFLKIVYYVSLAAFFIGSCLFHDEYLLPSPQNIEHSIEGMLSQEEFLIRVEPMQGGFANRIWHVYTNKGHYILREKAKRVKAFAFIKDVEMAKKASEYGIGPEFIGSNIRGQHILLRHIEHTRWPAFEKNPEPYKKAMLALKTFHEKMPSSRRFDKNTTYAPFNYVFHKGKQMQAQLPPEFSLALKKLESILAELTPWLKNHAVLCHGDFCTANVLLSKSLHPLLIDFDSASIGDPLFDIAKFSLFLSKEKRLELLQTYLGSPLSADEIRHFELIDLALLMLITTCRFNSVISFPLEEKLSQTEMANLLHSKALPSFLKLPFKNTSAQEKQISALCALSEFLERSSIIELNAQPFLVKP